jgi:hypothetical protein
MAVAIPGGFVTGILAQTGSGISGPPYKMRINEQVYWEDTPYNDRFNNTYDSNSYQLQYAFAGPGTAQTLTAVPSLGSINGLGGGGWTTTFSAGQAAAMTPSGIWYWQAILTGYSASFEATIADGVLTLSGSVTGTIALNAPLAGAGIPAGVTIVSGSAQSGVYVTSDSALNIGSVTAMTTALGGRVVAAEGKLIVEPDLSAISGTFDGRSVYEIGLANCEQALTVFQSSGGVIKSYVIGGRRMEFQDLSQIIELRDQFKAWVGAEQQAASGGQDRMIRIGFSPPSSGVPTSNSKNWPWW